jgi:hypothetical protein
MPPLTLQPGAPRPKQPLVYWPVLFTAIVFTLAFVVDLTLGVCSHDPANLSGAIAIPGEGLVVVHRPTPHGAPLHTLPTEETAAAAVPEPASAAKILPGAPVQGPFESAPHKPPAVTPPTPKKVEVTEKPVTPPPSKKVETVEKSVVPPPPEKVDVAKKPEDARETFGTSVQFAESPARAENLAKKERLLMFVLHISGNFEDSAFT